MKNEVFLVGSIKKVLSVLNMVVKKSRDDDEESMTHVGSVKTPHVTDKG